MGDAFRALLRAVRRLGRSLAQVALIGVVTIAGIETVGLVGGNNDYLWPARQLFTTKQAIRTIGDEGLWTYAPDRTVLAAATYRLSAWQGWVEYQCTISTNHFGLAETNVDAGHRAVDYLVLGDSFLEGQGGCPWLTHAALPAGSPLVVNGGLFGANLQTMELLERWLASQVQIRNVVLVLIGNDFKRTPIHRAWRAREACLERGQCDPHLDFVWAVDPGTTRQQLLALSRAIFDAQGVDWREQARRILLHYSLTARIYSRYAGLFGGPPGPDWEESFTRNFAAFDRLHARYPGLKILLVPQRDEVGLLGQRNADSERVMAFLTRRGAPFRTCALELSDYMPIDGHPNRAGYAKLLVCLREMLVAPTASLAGGP